MAGGRIDVSFGHELDDRRHERVAQLPGQGLGGRAEDDVVLSGNQIRTVLLEPAGADDDRVLPRLHRVPDLHPGHLFHEDGVDAVDHPRRVRVRRSGGGARAGDGGPRRRRGLRAAAGRRQGKSCDQQGCAELHFEDLQDVGPLYFRRTARGRRDLSPRPGLRVFKSHRS